MTNSINHNKARDAKRMEKIAAELAKNPDYRVLRRVRVNEKFGNLESQGLPCLAIIDFETTGLSSEKDSAIEIGLLLVEYEPISASLGRVLDSYSAFEDPGVPISEEITQVTGITDGMVSGQSFDDDRIQKIIDRCDIVIAHNAEFDRGFAEKRFSFMQDVAWGCSIKDVPWGDFGIGGNKLEYIASKLGYFYDAHRATTDCEATGVVLNSHQQDGRTPLWHLLEKARIPLAKIWAVDAPFETKDALKAAGYRWKDCQAASKKVWMIETTDIDAQVSWLAEHAISPGRRIYVEKTSSKDRFTDRSSGGEWMRL